MKARIEWRMGTDSHDLWLWEERGTTALRYFWLDGHWQTEEVEYGAQMEPSLNLPGYMPSVLLTALDEKLPASTQQANHLKDAQQVRDRLLGLVERSYPAAEQGEG